MLLGMETDRLLTDGQRTAIASWAADGLTAAEVVATASSGSAELDGFEVAEKAVAPIIDAARRSATEELLKLVLRDPAAVIRERGLVLIAELEAEVTRITERAASGRARWDELHRAGKLQQQAQNVARDLPPPPSNGRPVVDETSLDTAALLAAHTRTKGAENGN
jgi:hypothetical protein